jgi:hypothetical protein
MTSIGIGLIGTGYMGKAHAVALQAVGAVFNTSLRPVCEVICSTTAAGAAQKAAEFGFKHSTSQWRDLIDNPRVEAVVIASPQSTHLPIALAALAAGKPVFCEKPLGERDMAPGMATRSSSRRVTFSRPSKPDGPCFRHSATDSRSAACSKRHFAPMRRDTGFPSRIFESDLT